MTMSLLSDDKPNQTQSQTLTRNQSQSEVLNQNQIQIQMQNLQLDFEGSHNNTDNSAAAEPRANDDDDNYDPSDLPGADIPLTQGFVFNTIKTVEADSTTGDAKAPAIVAFYESGQEALDGIQDHSSFLSGLTVDLENDADAADVVVGRSSRAFHKQQQSGDQRYMMMRNSVASTAQRRDDGDEDGKGSDESDEGGKKVASTIPANSEKGSTQTRRSDVSMATSTDVCSDEDIVNILHSKPINVSQEVRHQALLISRMFSTEPEAAGQNQSQSAKSPKSKSSKDKKSKDKDGDDHMQVKSAIKKTKSDRSEKSNQTIAPESDQDGPVEHDNHDHPKFAVEDDEEKPSTKLTRKGTGFIRPDQLPSDDEEEEDEDEQGNKKEKHFHLDAETEFIEKEKAKSGKPRMKRKPTGFIKATDIDLEEEDDEEEEEEGGKDKNDKDKNDKKDKIEKVTVQTNETIPDTAAAVQSETVNPRQPRSSVGRQGTGFITAVQYDPNDEIEDLLDDIEKDQINSSLKQGQGDTLANNNMGTFSMTTKKEDEIIAKLPSFCEEDLTIIEENPESREQSLIISKSQMQQVQQKQLQGNLKPSGSPLPGSSGQPSPRLENEITGLQGMSAQGAAIKLSDDEKEDKFPVTASTDITRSRSKDHIHHSHSRSRGLNKSQGLKSQGLKKKKPKRANIGFRDEEEGQSIEDNIAISMHLRSQEDLDAEESIEEKLARIKQEKEERRQRKEARRSEKQQQAAGVRVQAEAVSPDPASARNSDVTIFPETDAESRFSSATVMTEGDYTYYTTTDGDGEGEGESGSVSETNGGNGGNNINSRESIDDDTNATGFQIGNGQSSPKKKKKKAAHAGFSAGDAQVIDGENDNAVGSPDGQPQQQRVSETESQKAAKRRKLRQRKGTGFVKASEVLDADGDESESEKDEGAEKDGHRHAKVTGKNPNPDGKKKVKRRVTGFIRKEQLDDEEDEDDEDEEGGGGGKSKDDQHHHPGFVPPRPGEEDIGSGKKGHTKVKRRATGYVKKSDLDLGPEDSGNSTEEEKEEEQGIDHHHDISFKPPLPGEEGLGSGKHKVQRRATGYVKKSELDLDKEDEEDSEEDDQDLDAEIAELEKMKKEKEESSEKEHHEHPHVQVAAKFSDKKTKKLRKTGLPSKEQVQMAMATVDSEEEDEEDKRRSIEDLKPKSESKSNLNNIHSRDSDDVTQIIPNNSSIASSVDHSHDHQHVQIDAGFQSPAHQAQKKKIRKTGLPSKEQMSQVLDDEDMEDSTDDDEDHEEVQKDNIAEDEDQSSNDDAFEDPFKNKKNVPENSVMVKKMSSKGDNSSKDSIQKKKKIIEEDEEEDDHSKEHPHVVVACKFGEHTDGSKKKKMRKTGIPSREDLAKVMEPTSTEDEDEDEDDLAKETAAHTKSNEHHNHPSMASDVKKKDGGGKKIRKTGLPSKEDMAKVMEDSDMEDSSDGDEDTATSKKKNVVQQDETTKENTDQNSKSGNQQVKKLPSALRRADSKEHLHDHEHVQIDAGFTQAPKKKMRKTGLPSKEMLASIMHESDDEDSDENGEENRDSVGEMKTSQTSGKKKRGSRDSGGTDGSGSGSGVEGKASIDDIPIYESAQLTRYNVDNDSKSPEFSPRDGIGKVPKSLKKELIPGDASIDRSRLTEMTTFGSDGEDDDEEYKQLKDEMRRLTATAPPRESRKFSQVYSDAQKQKTALRMASMEFEKTVVQVQELSPEAAKLGLWTTSSLQSDQSQNQQQTLSQQKEEEEAVVCILNGINKRKKQKDEKDDMVSEMINVLDRRLNKRRWKQEKFGVQKPKTDGSSAGQTPGAGTQVETAKKTLLSYDSSDEENAEPDFSIISKKKKERQAKDEMVDEMLKGLDRKMARARWKKETGAQAGMQSTPKKEEDMITRSQAAAMMGSMPLNKLQEVQLANTDYPDADNSAEEDALVDDLLSKMQKVKKDKMKQQKMNIEAERWHKERFGEDNVKEEDIEHAKKLFEQEESIVDEISNVLERKIAKKRWKQEKFAQFGETKVDAEDIHNSDQEDQLSGEILSKVGIKKKQMKQLNQNTSQSAREQYASQVADETTKQAIRDLANQVNQLEQSINRKRLEQCLKDSKEGVDQGLNRMEEPQSPGSPGHVSSVASSLGVSPQGPQPLPKPKMGSPQIGDIYQDQSLSVEQKDALRDQVLLQDQLTKMKTMEQESSPDTPVVNEDIDDPELQRMRYEQRLEENAKYLASLGVSEADRQKELLQQSAELQKKQQQLLNTVGIKNPHLITSQQQLEGTGLTMQEWNAAFPQPQKVMPKKGYAEIYTRERAEKARKREKKDGSYHVVSNIPNHGQVTSYSTTVSTTQQQGSGQGQATYHHHHHHHHHHGNVNATTSKSDINSNTNIVTTSSIITGPPSSSPKDVSDYEYMQKNNRALLLLNKQEKIFSHEFLGEIYPHTDAIKVGDGPMSPKLKGNYDEKSGKHIESAEEQRIMRDLQTFLMEQELLETGQKKKLSKEQQIKRNAELQRIQEDRVKDEKFLREKYDFYEKGCQINIRREDEKDAKKIPSTIGVLHQDGYGSTSKSSNMGPMTELQGTAYLQHLAKIKAEQTRRVYSNTQNLKQLEAMLSKEFTKESPCIHYKPGYMALVVSDEMNSKVFRPIGMDMTTTNTMSNTTVNNNRSMSPQSPMNDSLGSGSTGLSPKRLITNQSNQSQSYTSGGPLQQTYYTNFDDNLGKLETTFNQYIIGPPNTNSSSNQNRPGSAKAAANRSRSPGPQSNTNSVMPRPPDQVASNFRQADLQRAGHLAPIQSPQKPDSPSKLLGTPTAARQRLPGQTLQDSGYAKSGGGQQSLRGGQQSSPYKHGSYILNNNIVQNYRETPAFGSNGHIPLTQLATAMSHSSGMDSMSSVARAYNDPKSKTTAAAMSKLPANRHRPPQSQQALNPLCLNGEIPDERPIRSLYGNTISKRHGANYCKTEPRILENHKGFTDAKLLLKLGKQSSLVQGSSGSGGQGMFTNSPSSLNNNRSHSAGHANNRSGSASPSSPSRGHGGGRAGSPAPQSKSTVWGSAPTRKDAVVSSYDSRMARYSGAPFPHRR